MEMTKSSLFKKFGYLFYIVSPNRTSFERVDEVPNYVLEVVPFFVVLLGLEIVISSLKKKSSIRVNDGIGSLFQGMIQELLRATVKGIEITAYIYIYDSWRITSLPWNSPWTWFISFLGVDFCYYWLHRASHEMNILWAAHQVHHSSEDYNLTTALRQSAFQPYSVWMFNLPMAFFIPPSVFMVHTQFNLLYQFWIHTEVITNLGPLEFILNTPSHHRVHHGRNRYCIDKNYAGTLIIWDRMFGTFEPENEKVVYGLTHPVSSFSTFYIQLCHYQHILRMLWETEGLNNKISVLLKGPGWSPGKPRLGVLEDIPDAHYPAERYDPQVGFWCNVYIVYHFILVLLGHIEITERHGAMSQTVVLGLICFQLFSFTSIGALLDTRWYAPFLELLRCVTFLLVNSYLTSETRIQEFPGATKWIFTAVLQSSFALSAIIWVLYCSSLTSLHFSKSKTK